MKISKSWLNNFVKIEKSDRELDDLLTFSGTLVEEVAKCIDDKIIIAKIKEVKPHPNADRLRIATVFDGNEDLQIVCGAPNIEAGQTVPLAKVGAQIKGIEIKEAELRGIKSYGMLCSAKELGVSEDHNGIYILDNNLPIGKPLNKHIDSDSIFDLEITPNRGDCLSHLGVAREVSAITGAELNFKATDLQLAQSRDIEISIEDSNLCYRYSCLKIKGVKVAPSPKDLAGKISSVGLKPINNLVDITNFIMYDLGQPLHAFDAEKIHANEIIIRKSHEGEAIRTIDGIDRKLDDNMLVIADREKNLALAGVMGGLESSISEKTTSVILESAVFDPRSIRATAKKLKLSTDASARYERGVDAQIAKEALFKAANMICEIAGGEIVSFQDDFPTDIKNDFIKIDYPKINELIGINLSNEQIDSYLKSLGFEIKGDMAQPPSWRHDCNIWQDLAEEVARLHGFDQIKLAKMKESPAPRNADFYYKEKIKDLLVELEFSEVFSYPFLSQGDINMASEDTDNLLEVSNPIQIENRFLRNNLTVGLLKSIAKNPTFDPIQIFEIGNVFTDKTEDTNIALAVSGKGVEKTIKQAISALAQISGLAESEFEYKKYLSQDLIKYKIRKAETFVVEVAVSKIVEAMRENGVSCGFDDYRKDIQYREVSKYPPVKRDLAFLVDQDCAGKSLLDEIKLLDNDVILTEIFDEFSSDKLGQGKKSVALHIWFQDLGKTLSDSEADEKVSTIIDTLSNKFGAELRN